MSNNFRDYVADIERSAGEEERRLLDEHRRRYDLGAKLLERRLAAGMTQRGLADASGIGQAEISRIERGHGNPTLQTLQALGTPLGITLDYSPLETT